MLVAAERVIVPPSVRAHPMSFVAREGGGGEEIGCAQPAEQRLDPGVQRLTRAIARRALSLEQEHARAGAVGDDRRRAAGGPTADHHHLRGGAAARLAHFQVTFLKAHSPLRWSSTSLAPGSTSRVTHLRTSSCCW